MVRGLDNWVTVCRVENHGIDPQIIIEARNRSLTVLLGNFNVRQAREVAEMILRTCEYAEGA
jgi:hypothetical protein